MPSDIDDALARIEGVELDHAVGGDYLQLVLFRHPVLISLTGLAVVRAPSSIHSSEPRPP